MFGHKSRVALAISERGLTSHSSSGCPDFFTQIFLQNQDCFPFPLTIIFLFHSLYLSVFSSSSSLLFYLILLSQYGLGLQCVDSVKIIPDLLTLHASIPLLLLPRHRPPLLPLFLSHVRLNAGEFLVHMAIASIEGTRGADPQHGAVVVHSTEAELFREPGGHIGHHPGRGRRWQI